MTSLKLALILCVAVFYTCAQVPELQLTDAASEHQLEDAADEARKLLAQLEALINNTITQALGTFGSLMDQLNQTAIAIEEKAAKAFDATVKPFLESIEELKKKAAAAAIDISDCVGDSEEEISRLPKEFLKNVTKCTNSKLTEAKSYVDEAIKDCQSVLVIITDLGNQIEVCSKKMLFEQIVCFAEVTADITSDLATLPLKITSDVEKAKIYFAAAIPAIALCDSGVVAEISTEGAAIVANVTECAINKMNGTTTKAPSTSTKAPSTSTKAPSTSTKAPSTSTEAPLTSTKAPSTSTKAPSTSTKAPLTSTKAPSTSTKAPSTSTKGPLTSTKAPSTSTKSPLTSTKAPSTSTKAPSISTKA